MLVSNTPPFLIALSLRDDGQMTDLGVSVFWSVSGVVIISIVILATGDKTDAEFVFTDFVNETGWSDGTAWILGLLQNALTLIGYDAVMHMTEEMPNPRSDAPKAILLSIGVGGVT